MDTENLKDEDILKLALKDPSHFSVLVDKYQAAFLRKVFGIIRNREESEDIVQEAFVKIYTYGDKFKKQAGIEFKSWAYKILMNTAFTHYRKVQKTTSNVEYLDPVLYDEKPSENTEDLATINDVKKEVGTVLAKMPEHFARVLKLYYLEDKSYRDICKAEKLSIPALKMRLFRAKRIFEKLSTEI
ncbi:MAG: RNA polymerase sigma factor [Candidatus Pacebacteria bacterium]|nr:RNA polymerase sigma factor [Candidatus Paceibacterota bacterium]